LNGKRILVGFSVLLALTVMTISQTSSALNSSEQAKLTASQEQLVAGSKQAIIDTGITEAYFNSHFKLLEVIDKPSDRRVNWAFTVNGYRTIIRDSIGSSMQGTQRINTHSVAGTLGQTADIKNTLPRNRALKILKSCIGKNTTSPTVEYGQVNGQAQLLLVAHSINRDSEAKGEREKEREKEKREAAKAASRGTDMIESEGEEGRRPPTVIGSVNLQTGQCTKGVGLIAP
jgi:hypothetical protein